jgi:putative membrane protein
MRYLTIIFYTALILLGIGFSILNAHSVQINFYLTTVQIPVSVFVVLLVGCGMIFGFILSLGRYFRLNMKNRSLQNQLRLTEKEIKNLRAIPLQD